MHAQAPEDEKVLAAEAVEEKPTEGTKEFRGWRISYRSDMPEKTSYTSLLPKLSRKLRAYKDVLTLSSRRQRPVQVRLAKFRKTQKKKLEASRRVNETMKQIRKARFE